MGTGTTVAVVLGGVAVAGGLGVGAYFLLRKKRPVAPPPPVPMPVPAYAPSNAAMLGSATAFVGPKVASGQASWDQAAMGLLNTYAPGSAAAINLAKSLPGAGKVANVAKKAISKLKFW